MDKSTKLISGIKVVIPESYYTIDQTESVKWYDKHIVWTEADAQSPVDKFIENNLSMFNISVSDPNIELKKLGANNVLCNVIEAAERTRVLAVSFSRNKYSMPKIYGMRHFSYQYIVTPIKRLIENEYLDVRKGYYDKKVCEGKRTRVWPTEKLIRELNYFGEEVRLAEADFMVYLKKVKKVSLDFKRIFYRDPIILKNSTGVRIRKKLSRKNLAAKKFLLFYNDFISQFDIRINVEETLNYPLITLYNQPHNRGEMNITPPLLRKTRCKYIYNKELDCRLYRVFNNGKFTEGGRFYGAEYQSRSESQRLQITIDGESVTEVDFSGLHGRMLYQYCEKTDYQEDPYFIDKETVVLREAYKKMFQIILNSRSKVAAIEAFKKYLNQDENSYDLRLLLMSYELNEYDIYERITSKHKAISKYFNTVIGLRLQYVDSNIAENILKYFTYRNKACLCIHDSFIVKEKDQSELIEVMKREYKKAVGFECRLKLTTGEEL